MPTSHGDRFCSRCGAEIHGQPPRRRHRHPLLLGFAVATALVLGGVGVAAAVLGPTALAERWRSLVDPLTSAVADHPAAPAATTDAANDGVSGDGAAASDEVPEPPTATVTAAPEREVDLAGVFEEVRSGVVKIRASTCDGTGVGTGFLVDEQTVVTAQHVVAEAVSVVVNAAGRTIEADVVGVDLLDDLAVLELDEPVVGYGFDLASRPSPAGSTIAVIGHPLGEPITITQGVVSRLGGGIWPNIQIDAAINPGNSGGPVITADGEVIGIVVAKRTDADGIGLALRSDVAAPLIESPALLSPPEPALCAQPLGPEVDEAPDIAGVDALHEAVAETLANYFAGINTGDYGLAYDQFSPRLQAGASLDEFAAGVASSYDFAFDVRGVSPTAQGAQVWLEFSSLQDPSMGPDGEGCTEWSLDYTLVWSGDRMLIHRAQGHGGSEGHTPCS